MQDVFFDSEIPPFPDFEKNFSAQEYDSMLEWLFSTQMFGIKLGLDTPKELVCELHSIPNCKVIHVAGTNGKGSTCAMIERIAREHGIRTGLFTSPHLVDFRERIRINGKIISRQETLAGLKLIQQFIPKFPNHPTFFEISLALGMWAFHNHNVELIILETGMGGRLDATNSIPKSLAVITPIGLDHQMYLGDTLEKIASEKAAIIQAQVPVISATQEPEAKKIIQQIAWEKQSSLTFCTEALRGYSLSLPGKHQLFNAALACEAISQIGIHLRPENLASALQQVSWPARFQQISKEQSQLPFDLVIDGSHNLQGIQTLIDAWKLHFPSISPIAIFGAVSDKDVKGMLNLLSELNPKWHLVKINSPRAIETKQLEECLCAPAEIHKSLESALAFFQANPPSTPLLICGSLYLAGEALSLLLNQKHQKTAQ